MHVHVLGLLVCLHTSRSHASCTVRAHVCCNSRAHRSLAACRSSSGSLCCILHHVQWRLAAQARGPFFVDSDAWPNRRSRVSFVCFGLQGPHSRGVWRIMPYRTWYKVAYCPLHEECSDRSWRKARVAGYDAEETTVRCYRWCWLPEVGGYVPVRSPNFDCE
jgi:hypothetical protein